MQPIQIYWQFVLRINRFGIRLLPKGIQYKYSKLFIFTTNKNIFSKKNNHIFIWGRKIDLLKVNWNHKNKPKLWIYHLHYFDFLGNFDRENGIKIIHKWIESNPQSLSSAGWEPYPISLRVVNWIKFIIKYSIYDKKIFDSLSLQGYWLFKQREYRLLTNHLFKNIVALLYLGFLFNKKKWGNWALKEFKKQLEEQVTDEGYHFEFSPTYHALFVKDLLDIYNLIKNNTKGFYDDLLKELSEKIQKGLHWLDYFSEDKKYLPINDVNYEGCPLPSQLKNYASSLGIQQDMSSNNKISKYYPILESGDLKIMLYCAPINPAYNPAHSHADMLSILLWDNHNPILIDTGNYDYEESDEREYARSTFAHNTIVIDNENQCGLWKVFRIGSRGKLFDKKVTKDFLQCSYSYYKKMGIIHKRTITKEDSGFLIQDFLFGKGYHNFEMFFHFAPELVLEKNSNILTINHQVRFEFFSNEILITNTSYFPKMFIKEEKQTVCISGEFENKKTLITTIRKNK
jgi:uncharacterized heparinase superfamily protein